MPLLAPWALALVACGGGDDTPAPAADARSGADVGATDVGRTPAEVDSRRPVDAVAVVRDSAPALPDGPLRDERGPADAAPADALVPDAAVAPPMPDLRSLGVGCYDPGAAYVESHHRWVVFCGGHNDTFYRSDDGVHFVEQHMSYIAPAWIWQDPATGQDRIGGWQPARLHGAWYLYFGARDRTNPVPGRETPHVSIGVFAVPDGPDGPFADAMVLHNASDAVHDAPLVRREGFTLQDVYPFEDRGPQGDGDALYVFYNQFNADKSESGIYVNRLSDPATKVCCQTQLLRARRSAGDGTAVRGWAGTTVEAPAAVRYGANVYLFFSGGLFDDVAGRDPFPYQNGIARAPSAEGPFVEYPADRPSPPYYPQLTCERMTAALDRTCVLGPGSGAATADGFFYFNAQLTPERGRSLYRARIVVQEDAWLGLE